MARNRMLLSSLLLVAGLISPLLARPADLQTAIVPPSYSSSTIRDILFGAEIIGDVLDDFEPTYYIDLAYSKAHEPVLLGNDIPVPAAANRPAFIFHALDPTPTSKNSTFTLAMTDPDATSRVEPTMSEMCHWILTNLTNSTETSLTLFGQSSSADVLTSEKTGELMSYYPPAPPPKTGKHRYVFVLLEGDLEGIEAPKSRQHWGYGKIRHGVKDWAKDNDLKVVGANFFYASNKKQ